ncbi:hypothetical protein MMK73_003351 [Providencia rettgeri]|uniref:hypothetical protein n=1 Tax=Providencia sp. TaxID=589 RepID=UPI0024AA4F6D|nr:hypothetical protein [Providencia rettgeri]
MAYWKAGSVPELKGLESKEQKQLFKQCLKEGKTRLGARYWYLNGLVILLCIALGFLLFAFELYIGGFLGGMIIGGGIGLLFVFIVQTPTVEAGRAWLQEQGYPKAEQ